MPAVTFELASALRGKHEHTPEAELRQIAAIAINWLRKIERERIAGEAKTDA